MLTVVLNGKIVAHLRGSLCWIETSVCRAVLRGTQFAVGGRQQNRFLHQSHYSKHQRRTMYTQYKQARLQQGESVVKSLNDPKDYRVIHLNNGLTALLVEDKETSTENKSENDDGGKSTKLAAAALCVGVGSFSDPAELPGLAHFLEHMVFMGSEKYPNENEFDEFVKKHGGMNNAYTECEHTVYYFNIEKSAFQKGLDIFSGFFTKPLMKEGSVDREIKAVDSEFSMSKPRDNPRLEMLYCSMAKSGHPMSKFTWGNLQSLKETPAKQGINLHQRVREFYAEQYSAEYMTLVVQAMHPLDTLQDWVTEIFSAVPNIGTKRPTFEHLPDPFDTDRYNKLYKMIPCMNKHRVSISWSLPSLLKEYKSKPLHYLGFLVGHEGKGSIMAYLRRNMLAVTLEGGNSEYGYEHNTTHAVFTVTIQLTETGFDKYMEVVAVVMEYMKMLRREGPKEWIYNEIKTIEDNSFRWIEESDPIENVEEIVPNMLRYPEAEYLTGDKLYTEYKPQLISDCVKRMTPDKANITLLSKKFLSDNCCTLKEPWYKTDYCTEDIPAECIKKWTETEPRSELHLPEPNEFIASDFSLKDVQNHTEYPVAISDTKQGRLWFKQDNKFKVPKGNVSFLLISPAVKASATSLCMVDLVLLILEHQMTETAYAASVASLSYSLKRQDHGLSIAVSGFSHKLLKLFKTVVDFIAGLTVDQDLLDTMKKQLEKEYYNKSIRPRQLNTDLRLAVLRHNEKTLVDCQQALPCITVAMVTGFLEELTTNVYVEGLVQGNITAQEALQYEEYLLKTLKCKPITGDLPQHKILDLPASELYIRTDNLDKNDENSVIFNYYQHGPGDFHKLAVNELLLMRMEEPCFDILRTREQLGYSVGCTSRLTDGIIGFSVSVCSQAHKFDLETVNKKVEDFLVEFEALLGKDTEEDFETVRNSLITLKQCADSNLGEEVDRNWAEICDRLYNFDVKQRTIEELKKLTFDEVKNWLKSMVLSGGPCKKLSIQVEGHKSAAKETAEGEGVTGGEGGEDEDMEQEEENGEEEGEEEEEEEEQAEPESYTFQDLVFKPVDGQPEGSVITDIAALQRTCSFYPSARLV